MSNSVLESAASFSEPPSSESFHEHPIVITFPHEQQAIRRITNALDSWGECFSNYQLHDPALNRYFECDVIVIAPDQINIVELKHWSGTIRVKPNNWLVNDQKRPDPHPWNGFKCKILKSFCKKILPSAHIPWVKSIVVLTNPDARVHGAHGFDTRLENPTFRSIEMLEKHFNYRKKNSTSILRPDQVKKLAAGIRKTLPTQPSKTFTIPGYEFFETITQTPKIIELLARSKGNELQAITRFRIFPTSLTTSIEKRKEQRNRAMNSLKALERIDDHPNVIRVWRIPHEDGHIIEASKWSNEGTLADTIRQEAPLPYEKTLPLIQGILEGLQAVHDYSIIHRNLTPDNILMKGAVPQLMNFDLSYIPEDHRMTVLDDSVHLPSSPYTAPELLEHQDCSESGDLFSLGVIWYELLCGKPPFKSSLNLKNSGGVLEQQAYDVLAARHVPETIQVFIATLIQQNPDDRFQRAADCLEELQKIIEPPPPVLPTNCVLEPGESHGVYEIERLIGTGREAQVYLAKQTSEWQVALKLFHHDIASDRITAERNALMRINSPYIVRCHSIGQWHDSRLFLIFDFIQGTSLRNMIDAGERPTPDMFRQVAGCVLQAVKSIHAVRENDCSLLHNDIKPANIIITPDNTPVVLDFGIAKWATKAAYMGTPNYTAPDLLTDSDFDFCESGDLFALGMTLFEWVCGKRPYRGVPSLSENPASVHEFRQDIPATVQTWLIKSVQPRREDRFSTIDDMLESFKKAWLPKPPKPILTPILSIAPPPIITPETPPAKWRVDASGGMLVQFDERKYVSVLPVTKHQFERYLWNAAPSWCDYAALVEETGRITPSQVTEENLTEVFLTNISFLDAEQFCWWVHGRLPTWKDLEGIYQTLFRQNGFLKTMRQESEASLSSDALPLDTRWERLVDTLIEKRISRYALNESVGEFASLYTNKSSYGKIHAMYQHTKRFLGRSSRSDVKNTDFGFSYILEL